MFGRSDATWVCPTRCDSVQKATMINRIDSLHSVLPAPRQEGFGPFLDTGNCGNLESTR
jgi:hypothetical protein